MWLQYEAFDPPLTWWIMEANNLYIHSSTRPYSKNRMAKTSLRIRVQFRPYFGLQSFSASAPLVANRVFLPPFVANAFAKCSNLGIRKFKDFYIAITFASFQQLFGQILNSQSGLF